MHLGANHPHASDCGRLRSGKGLAPLGLFFGGWDKSNVGLVWWWGRVYIDVVGPLSALYPPPYLILTTIERIIIHRFYSATHPKRPQSSIINPSHPLQPTSPSQPHHQTPPRPTKMTLSRTPFTFTDSSSSPSSSPTTTLSSYSRLIHEYTRQQMLEVTRQSSSSSSSSSSSTSTTTRRSPAGDHAVSSMAQLQSESSVESVESRD